MPHVDINTERTTDMKPSFIRVHYLKNGQEFMLNKAHILACSDEGIMISDGEIVKVQEDYNTIATWLME